MNNFKVDNPIGIFDSGIGGLTVASAIHELLPNEKIIYFGDTIHLPYGEKSKEAIQFYAQKITEYLLKQQCKMVVIACNSASSTAFNIVKKLVHNKAIAVNVIDPVIQEVSNKYKNCKVGIIGTKTTINSRVYVRKLIRKNSSLDVVSVATPLLAPMIEEGFYNNLISKTVINSYLSKKNFTDIKVIILGCTHYPLIKEEVNSFFKNNVEVVDSAVVVAQEVKQVLEQKKLLNKNIQKQKHQFIVSDYTESFKQSAQQFFHENVNLMKHNIWSKEGEFNNVLKIEK